MKLFLISSVLFATLFAIALPNHEPVPGFGSSVLNRLEDRGLNLGDKLLTRAAKQVAKARAESFPPNKELFIRKATKYYVKGEKKVEAARDIHKTRQNMLLQKIKSANYNENNLEAQKLTSRIDRKAVEWQQRIRAYRNKHEGISNFLKDNNRI